MHLTTVPWGRSTHFLAWGAALDIAELVEVQWKSPL
jgi:hypothetical protein